MVVFVGARLRRSRRRQLSKAPRTLRGKMIMMRTIIAALVAFGIVGSIAAPAFAHKPRPQATAEKPSFPPKDFWDQQTGGY